MVHVLVCTGIYLIHVLSRNKLWLLSSSFLIISCEETTPILLLIVT